METPLFKLISDQEDVIITILSPFSEDKDRVESEKKDNLCWKPIQPPPPDPNGSYPVTVPQQLKAFAYSIMLLFTFNKAQFGNLVYRFNHIHQFANHSFMVKLPPKRKEREAQAGNYVNKSLGFPFPGNRFLLRQLHKFYYSTWQRNDRDVESFFTQEKFDLVVISHVQNPTIKPFVVAANRRHIPILGMLGSWDQATTKGPLCPGIVRHIVQTPIMRRELLQYHDVPEEKIDVVGWPQMDVYKKSGVIQARDGFLRALGIPNENKVLLFAANTPRLGAHEPGIIKHIAQQAKSNAFGHPCSLIVRPHPRDAEWHTRFSQMQAPPETVVLPAEKGRLDFLTNLLAHSNITLASSGSIALDSIALNTPVINIGFDGDLDLDFYNSSLRFCETDHYLNVINSGGVRLVKNYDQLDQAIIEYLDDPSHDQAGRQRLRSEQLEPFDGYASERILSLIISEAQKSHHKPLNNQK